MKTNNEKEVKNFRLNLDGIEEEPKDFKKMSPEAIQLYAFSEKIFIESEEFISRLSYLNENRFNNYNAQSILLDKKICNTLKNSVNKFLRRLRICQITYTELLTIKSLKTVAIETFEAFNRFMKTIFPSIEQILQRCHEKQNSTFPGELLTKEDLKIDSEVKRYINFLQYHFNNLYDLKICSDTKYQEKLKKVTIDLNSFYKKVLDKYCELNPEIDIRFPEDLLVEQQEIVEKKQLPENHTQINVESAATHKPHVSDLTSTHDNAVENAKDDTTYLLYIFLGGSILTLLIVLIAGIGLFLKSKKRRPTINEIEEDHKLIED